jgi:glycosyltransferase involved in cell wall biosynthesis
VLVVNDASPDRTETVVRKFEDSRIKYIAHKENRGLPASRNTGMRVASGDLIALLDSDDIFHPDKLQAHVSYLEQHPEIGVTYNCRFDLNHSAETVRRLWRPPLTVGLADFVLGFPFTPSDMVIRREWALRINLFDETFICGGEDTDFPCRLALEGCQFAGIDRALNFRRYHSGRPRKNLSCRLRDVERALSITFEDPRCPDDVLALRDIALKHHLMVLVSLALIQNETSLGVEFLRRLEGIDPSVFEDNPSELISFLIREVVADENLDHELLLRKVIEQLPPDMQYVQDQYDWAVARGYVEKGARNIMWGQLVKGNNHLKKAHDCGAKVQRTFLDELAAHLLNYKVEFGSEAAQIVLNNLTHELEIVAEREDLQYLSGLYFLNSAFRDYRKGQFREALPNVFKAITSNRRYLANRGVLVLLSGSLLKSPVQFLKKEHLIQN